MKALSPTTMAVLQSRNFYQVDCYTISGGALGNNVLRYCSGDQDVTLNGNLYPCGGAIGPFWDRQDERARVQMKAGMEVDTITIDLIPGSATLFGSPFLVALLSGILDGAEFRIDRCYMPLGAYGDTRGGSLLHFAGRIGDIEFGRSMCVIQVNSHKELLDIQLPRNQFQPGCVYNLYDSGCGVNPASYQYTGVVGSGSTNSTIYVSSLSSTALAGQYDLGKVQFTSGALNGLVASIKVCVFGTPNVIQLLGFLPSAPAPGDTFNIWFGCDKTLGINGCQKFNNIPRYRGFPFVPLPTLAV